MQYPLKKKYHNHNRGFTLVELIVALGLFAVVSTISIGSLITLMDNNRQLRGDQAIITNIGFAFDMMTRDIRQGVDYHCASGIDFNNQNSISVTQDCENGRGIANKHGVSFRPPETLIDDEDDTRVAYYYDESEETIMRRVGDREPERIVSNTLTVLDADFLVTDTDVFEDGVDNRQPTVTIFLEVRAEDGNEYRLQSTVTQRLLDI